MSKAKHNWNFFYAGGFEQVDLQTPADLANLKNLDQKLWASLACPRDELEIDAKFLAYLDTNNDGRIRAPELLSAIDWTLDRLENANLLFNDKPITQADYSQNDAGKVLAHTAARLEKLLNKTDGVIPADTSDLTVLFPANQPNGDGIISENFTQDENLQTIIQDIIATQGAQEDRSGEDGINSDTLASFYEQLAETNAWHQKAQEVEISELEDTAADAAAAYQAVAEKIDDYFNRIELIAFDPRAKELVNGEESELIRLSATNLADTSELLPLPIATITDSLELPLSTGINPAWRAQLNSFKSLVVTPIKGELESLTQENWTEIKAKFADYLAWQASKPEIELINRLDAERIAELINNSSQEELKALIALDETVAEEANGLLDLDKLLRIKAGLVTLLKNFISFQHFYSLEKQAIFQAGKLYIDGKSTDLTVRVKDIASHSALAATSNNYLIYCKCTRRNTDTPETMNLVAAITAGDEGNLAIGRNGLFYDRDGNDWDATIVKIINNPISIREAFWSPYKRVANMISEKIQRLAQERDNEVMNKASTATNKDAPAEEKAFDIGKFAGIFAAIGLALAALGAALASIISSLQGLIWWQWIAVIFGIIVIISGPSMLLAWFKLRQRNLGPILDANGWAVNTKAKISIAFGTTLTQLAKLPQGSKLSYGVDKKKSKTPLVLLIILILAVGTAIYFKDEINQKLTGEEATTEMIEEAEEALENSTEATETEAPAEE